MAHNWNNLTTTRQCTICGALQTRTDKYAWYPLVGLCTNDRRGRPPLVQQTILDVLVNGPLHRDIVAQRCSKSITVIAAALTRLRQAGKVRRVGKGVWEIVEEKD